MLGKVTKELFLKEKSSSIDLQDKLTSNSKIKNHVLIFEFKNVKRTGTFLRKKAYNQLFFNVKKNFYAPIPHTVDSLEDVIKIVKHARSRRKVVKYYTDKVFKNIKDVHIVCEDPYLALPHLLAYWPDYDLIKHYYKKVPLKEVDKTLWGHYLIRDLLIRIYRTLNIEVSLDDILTPEEKLFLTSQKFNLFGFMDIGFLEFTLPVFYKDGVLIPKYSHSLTNLQNFDKPTTKEVIKTILKNIATPNYINKRDWLTLLLPGAGYKVFPYYFSIGLTDYGCVVNLYKFNFKTLKHDLIAIKPVYVDHSIFNTNFVVAESIKCKITNKLTLIKEEPDARYIFGIDDKYIYITESLWYGQQFHRRVNIHIYKIPIEKIKLIVKGVYYTTLIWEDYQKTALPDDNLCKFVGISFPNNL